MVLFRRAGCIQLRRVSTRLAIIDEASDAKLYDRFRSTLNDEETVESSDLGAGINANTQERIEQASRSQTGNFVTERIDLKGRSLAEVRSELNRRIAEGELDAYLILPADILPIPKVNRDYGRNIGDCSR